MIKLNVARFTLNAGQNKSNIYPVTAFPLGHLDCHCASQQIRLSANL